ncbi:hypothetical protein GLX27_000382 [Malassezia furfur]|uniref:VOC domain-containing protein n=1 Tax=Malassezia furfur TaxID=55194 RepID=A0ABY8EJ72_MALFU|nr:hypothetical protein GLX27_000382 [Malassezia furfur]
MSNPWRDTKGFSFHSICIQVKDIDESVMFYQEVFGMDMVREVTVGDISKVWLRFPANKDSPLFGHAHSLIELVQRKGTDSDANFQTRATGGGFHHLCFSVPDILKAKRRFESLGVDTVDIGSAKNDIIVIHDPDHYPIQLISQDFDMHEELEKACRHVVLEGAEQAIQDLRLDNNPVTLEEAGIHVASQAQ